MLRYVKIKASPSRVVRRSSPSVESFTVVRDLTLLRRLVGLPVRGVGGRPGSTAGSASGGGHVRDWSAVDDTVDGLPDDFAAAPPRTDARFTLLAGAENRCFPPSGQRRTHAWLEARRPGASELHVLPGYTHMDVFFGRDAARDVFPRIVAALAR